MKFLTYRHRMFGPRAGVLKGDRIVDLTNLLNAKYVIQDIGALLEDYNNPKELVEAALAEKPDVETLSLDEVRLLAPVLKPRNIRDGSVFERHVVAAGENNGVGTPPIWYQVPLYYYHNTSVITGPEDAISRKPGSTSLDYEAEVALVIGKEGTNLITEEEILDHIFGLTIYNDWSDRDMCTFEVGFLGLHKGKDFANGFGPYVVTMDEFMDKYQDGKLPLKVDAWVNDRHTTDSMTDDMYWTLPQLMARVTADSMISPGDIIGLGTVGKGCIYERPYELPYLADGDCVKIQIEGIGTLCQYVAK